MKYIETQEEFFRATMGGRPNQKDLSNFDGHSYDCGCGKKHTFYYKDGPYLKEERYSPIATYVLRELKFSNYVFNMTHCDYHNLVSISIFGYFKTKLTFKHGDPWATIKNYEREFDLRKKFQ